VKRRGGGGVVLDYPQQPNLFENEGCKGNEDGPYLSVVLFWGLKVHICRSSTTSCNRAAKIFTTNKFLI